MSRETGCLHPIYVFDKSRGHRLYRPCGKCPNCRARARYELTARLWLEHCFTAKSFFCTWTYSDEYLPMYDGRPAFDLRTVQDSIALLRYYLSEYSGTQIRYFLTCEYGEEQSTAYYLSKYNSVVGRPHYHLIIFTSNDVSLEDMRYFLQESWPLGRVQCNTATVQTMQYCSKYALKDDELYTTLYESIDARKPFRLFSSRPGLGLGFPNKDGRSDALAWLQEYVYNDGEVRDRFPVSGRLSALSRYLRDHLDPSIKAELQNSALDYEEASQAKYAERALRFGADKSIDREIIEQRKAIRKMRYLLK